MNEYKIPKKEVSFYFRRIVTIKQFQASPALSSNSKNDGQLNGESKAREEKRRTREHGTQEQRKVDTVAHSSKSKNDSRMNGESKARDHGTQEQRKVGMDQPIMKKKKVRLE